MSASGMPRAAIHGHIAARIDRLPLTRVQWHLAILVEITWGFIIFDTDGIGARLYPFVWRPNHIIDVVPVRRDPGPAGRRSASCSASIMMSWVADRYGRRPAILLATFLGGLCIWPFAYVTNFWGMVVPVGAQHAWRRRHRRHAFGVSLRNDLARWLRNKVLLASQGVTALVAVGVNLLAFWLGSSRVTVGDSVAKLAASVVVDRNGVQDW